MTRALARSERAAPARRRAALLCSGALDGLLPILGPAYIAQVREECGGDPVLALVRAVEKLRKEYPLGSRLLEEAVRREARARVARHLAENPGLAPVRAVLFGKLYAGLLRRFGAERAHLAPRLSVDGVLEYVRTFPLPGPDTLPAFAWSLLCARARLGITQQALAGRLGVTRRRYAAWESGRARPTPAQEEWLRGELERLA